MTHIIQGKADLLNRLVKDLATANYVINIVSDGNEAAYLDIAGNILHRWPFFCITDYEMRLAKEVTPENYNDILNKILNNGKENTLHS